MITNLSHVMTLANGIIGVSVLAMPFCFKQCGIILSILILLVSSMLSKFACHLLVKSAVMSRRRNFEFLAFHAFGRTGKFLAELFIIGFLMGTCIAFFVVVGDLGPEIVGKMIGKSPADIRTGLLVTIGMFIILPLGLLRNVDSLSSICTATIGFYLCLVLKVMTESMTHIFATDWYDKVFYWRPSGILQCLPIFSMALFCQTQLFEIYETIPNVCLEKMNQVVHDALNICTVVYVCVGFFGYVAFCTTPFTGNILMSFEPSLSSEAIKIGFVLSVAFSFPLVIFPCRASLNSLLFRWAHSHETSSNYIPETRFRWLTFLIVAVSLVTGILIPNIEFVLGLVGSTIGVMICLMFPAAFFISISSKNTNERLIAQAMLFIGVWVMILGTYANLYAMEESANAKLFVTTGDALDQLNIIPPEMINDRDVQMVPPIPKINEIPSIDNEKFKPLEVGKVHEDQNSKDDVRQEPPIPVERAVVTEKPILDTKNPGSRLIATLSPVIQDIVEDIKKLDKNMAEKSGDDKQKYEADKNAEGKEDVVVLEAEAKIKEIEMNDNRNAGNLVHLDAIKREDTELAAAAELAEAEHDKTHEELKKTLKEHEKEQRQMLQEQKEIINTLKQQKQEFEKERKEKEANKRAEKKGDREDRETGIHEGVNLDKNRPMNIEDENLKPNVRAGDVRDSNKSAQAAKTKSKDNKPDKLDTRVDEDTKDNKDPSLVETENNKTVKKSRGPILSALVKEASNSSITNNVPMDDKKDRLNAPDLINSNLEGNQKTGAKEDDGTNLSNNNVQTLTNNNVPAPIALVMREQTKTKDIVKKSDENSAIRRDLLENLQRRKREVDGTLVNDNQNPKNEQADEIGDDLNRDKVKSFVNDIAQGDSDNECFKTEESLNNVDYKSEGKKEEDNKRIDRTEVTTELLLIKTNSYLSDQSFVNADSLGENSKLKIEFENTEQRDSNVLVSSKNGNSK